MRHLVVGAGATLAEALALGNGPEACPPLIHDFARKTWSNYTPYPILEVYLRQLGYQSLGHDPRELFYELEEKGVTNIERFMEFAWENRNRSMEVGEDLPPGYISGLRITTEGNPTVSTASEEGGFWDDLLYHGIGNPLSFLISQCFFENGKGWKSLHLSKSVAARLEPDDLIFNLNYDTVFELVACVSQSEGIVAS
jgi:hypothetical protein